MQPIDADTFFRETTLRICGSLEIEKALHNCFVYFRQFLPVDILVLSHFRPDQGIQAHLAEADETGGRLSDFVTPFQPDTLAEVKRLLEQGTLPPLEIIEAPETHPITRLAIQHWGRKPCSLLLVRLMVDHQFIGAFSTIAQGRGCYTQTHAALLDRLRQPFALAMSNYLRYRQVLELKDGLSDENRYLHREIQRLSRHEIIGSEFGLRGVMEMVRQVAPQNSAVLLSGETGTGKELIANAIHAASFRREGPFITVNCGAIADNLIDSELFGHEKGAFTGAVSRKIGRFERANKGTIFLDEIGELPQGAQVRLLRVLQEKQIERVGGSSTLAIDIRVIAATHRNLEEMVAAGTFRQDLYFRLRVFPIIIPPLRERAGDIPVLVQHIIRKKAQEMALERTPTMAPGAIERLLAYSWPGNVRELENVVERALILSYGAPLTFSEVQPSGATPLPGIADPVSYGSLLLDEVTANHIRHVMARAKGKIEGPGGAAQILGIKPNTLRHRMRKLGIAFGRRARGRHTHPS